jgi:YD repeat-containing protein
VLTERRAAQRATGSLATASAPVVASHADDRVTTFVYDKNGRRRFESRANVLAYSVDANGGLVDSASTVATIEYRYNGLGMVTHKIEATGDTVVYDYDLTGRLAKETHQAFADQADALVKPTVTYSYNGLDLLTQTRQGGETPAAGDRITVNEYVAGRLASTTDATGAKYSYAYDAAGNLLRESYTRQRIDAPSVEEALLYNRDILGRVTSRTVAAKAGSTWAKGDTQDIEYNLFGEISKRGTNGKGQEQYGYDQAGRLTSTNSGDGVWRFFVQDRNGHQTLAIESEGMDLAGKSLDEVLTIARGGSPNVGGAYVADINISFTVYDQRGSATETRLPHRELNATDPRVELVLSRDFNAFGEVFAERDAKGALTTYVYNTMGRTISISRPIVASTNESGVDVEAQPVEMLYFDLSGRLVGSRDPNGHAITRQLLAGTGYGGTEALTITEFHADGGRIQNRYDVFGDLRVAINEVNRTAQMTYDARGRLIRFDKAGGLVEHFVYDLMGQRIKHWNSVLLETDAEITEYDMQGRIRSQRAFGGDVTTTSYQWAPDMVTEGMGTFGGWIETTTYANNLQKIELSDVFGRAVKKTDLGGHVFNMKYDKAARLVEQSGGETMTYAYLNSGTLGSVTTSRRNSDGYMEQWDATYGYDSNGNKVREQLSQSGVLLQDASAEYDSLNRLTLWTEAGTASTPYSRVAYKYDANSNIRMIHADYVGLDGYGNLTGMNSKEHWYRFDAMNRVVVSKGVFGNNGIVAGPEGVEIGYDQAGQRVRTLRREERMGSVYAPPPWDVEYRMPYTHETVETYTYDDGGHLDKVFGSETTVSWEYGFSVNPPAEPGTLKADYDYDALGRLRSQKDYRDGWDVVYEHTVTDYTSGGQVFTEFTVSKQLAPNPQNGVREWTTFRTETKYYYGGETQTAEELQNEGAIGPDALGGVVKVVNKNLRNGALTHWSVTDTAYNWWDGAVQSVVALRADLWDPTKDSHSLFTYNAWGQLEKVNVNDGRRREVRFTNNLSGEAIRRDEQDFRAAGDPHEVWHRFNGRQMGYVGNNGTLNIDYQSSINARTHYVGPSQGAFRLGDGNPTAYADFDQNYSAINSFEQGSTGGTYTVRAGDTLSSIAAQLWGDSSLWYKLAEANGLGGESGLTDGQMLTIPVGIFKNHHTASTFMPFDPGSVVGDLSPTAPQPQAPVHKKNKCGIFGTILLIVVAAAVTFLTQGALAGPMTGLLNSALAGNIAAGAIAGVAGSLASQTVGVLTGIQERFDWKGVAMAGISGAVGGALGGWNAFGKTGLGKFTDLANNITRAAAASAITQGIGVAAGLQGKFSWAAVAAAGVSAAVGPLASAKLGVEPFVDADGVRFNGSFGNFVKSGLAMSAAAVANAATKSLIDGSDFGDNLTGGLAGVIGSTIGNLISYRMADAPITVNAKPGSATSTPSGDGGQTSSPPDDQGEGGAMFIKAGFQQEQEKKKNLIGGVDVGEPTPNGRPPWQWLDPDAPEHLQRAFYNEWRDMRTVMQTTVSFEDVVKMIWEKLFPDKNINDYWREPAEDTQETSEYEEEYTPPSGFSWPALNAGSNYYEPPPESFGEEVFNAGQDLVTAAILQDVYFDVFPDSGSVMSRRTDTRAAMFGRILGSFSPHADFINIPRSIYGVRNGEEGARFGLAVNMAGIGPSPFDIVKAATKVGKPAKAAEKTLVKDLERELANGARSNIVARSGIPTIGGRLPINSKYAGKLHPSGVRFTKLGFPDFKPYAKAEAKIKNLTGVYATDAALANAAVGLKSTPVGFVWHHVEDGLTMQLIPQSIHRATRHSGGASVIKNGGFDR